MKNTFFTYAFYLLFYSVGGFFLERIINIIFLGTPYDNSFLYGPYQPLYGFGILFTILFYDFVIKPLTDKKSTEYIGLLIGAIFFTAFIEIVTGELLELLTSIVYWDYRLVLSLCQYPYSCSVPTSLFGVFSAGVIIVIHPKIKDFRLLIDNKWIIFMLVIFTIDAILSIAHYL